MPVCGRGQTDKFARAFASLDKIFTRSPSKCCRLPVVILSGDVNIMSIAQVVVCAQWMENIHTSTRRC
jgi:hypothetical protein